MGRPKGKDRTDKRKNDDRDSASDDDQHDHYAQQPASKKPKLTIKVRAPEPEPENDEESETEEVDVTDCVCGTYGHNLDDGRHQIACDGCNLWHHTDCHDLSEEEVEAEEFHFFCSKCQKQAAEGEDGNLSNQCGNCNKVLTSQERKFPGPSGKADLCAACYQRYNRARKAGKEASGEWKKSRQDSSAKEAGKEASGEGKKSRKRHGGECQNCEKVLTAKDRKRPGPEDTTLCETCASRYKRAKKAGTEASGEWRRPATKNESTGAGKQGEQGEAGKLTGAGVKPARKKIESYDYTCRDCGRHNSDLWERSRCGYCAHRHSIPNTESRPTTDALAAVDPMSYAELRDLAHRQYQQLHPHDPFESERRRPVLGPNYWYEEGAAVKELSRARLVDMLLERGMRSTDLSRHRYRNSRCIDLLQLDDAWDGILPRADPSSVSELNTLSADDLKARATAAHFAKEMGADANLTAETAREFLAGKRDATDHIQPVDPNTRTQWAAAIEKMAETLQGQPKIPPTHQSHNGAIQGSERAMARLSTTLANGHLPALTSSRGFQCGPIALANTIRAVRDHYNSYIDSSMRPDLTGTHVTPEDLRSLLFENWDDASVRRVGAQGVPTAAYTEYLNEYLRNADIEVSRDERREMLRLNDMGLQQLIAMVVLLHRNRGLDDFNVGVVTDARYGVPAQAHIVHEGENNAPTLWLHHNQALGRDEYNHWEGFEPPQTSSDYDLIYDWGLATGPLMNDVARRRFRATDGKSNEDAMARAIREFTNAAAVVTSLRRAGARACKRCVEKGKVKQCKRVGGHRYCDPCDEDGEAETCEWPFGSPESVVSTWKKASELHEEDLRAYNRPLDQGAEETMLNRTMLNQPSPQPTGRHFLAIFCGRKSSHPGALAMINLIQALIITSNAYNNLLNDPAYQPFPEGQRPGGAGTTMWAHILAFARHGAMPVPTHHGNVDNDALHAFINLMDMILAAGAVLPDEIDFVLHGIAGFSVDITGWGSRTHGFFRHVLDADAANGTNIAGRIYIIPVMELHVVDPASPNSLNFGNAAHGVQYNMKRVVKYRLMDLIDRRDQLFTHAGAIGMPFAQYMHNVAMMHTGGVVPVNFPNPPAWPAGVAQAIQLDRFIMGMYWERSWRVGYLDANTMPTELQVRTNNTNRNAPM
ncbi:hypothetical protein LTR56_005727 [Elasticomyces elasticus]|nr:hypothetical protein LTR56_005727 [Elasticomyces elasticus]KAK3657476.1 hypothetical protein LTR22_009342 [Elasticomyces elasticus]KAK4925657.1 hypothetical protein LTR49_007267 [Elasticomyces elasticus]KAK5764989.1 hypothetical protein LTS12_004767 [Elasticomyces elasticus]